jgi:hypothetical protein
MGSWFKTCGLTDLPIVDYEEVVIIPLVANNYYERSGTEAFWSPFQLPFQGVFNGSTADDLTGFGLTLFSSVLEKATSDSFSVSDFLSEIINEKVEITMPNGKISTLDAVMMRKSSFDHVIDDFKFSEYVGEGQGDLGFNNSYIEYGFEDIIKDLPEWLPIAKQNDSENNRPSFFLTERTITSMDRVSKFLRSVGQAVKTPPYPLSFITMMMDANQEEATQIMTDFLKLQYIDKFMSEVRRTWSPTGFEGSQSLNLKAYEFMSDLRDDAVTNLHYNDNEDEEYEEESESNSPR